MTRIRTMDFDREAIIRGILDGELPAEVLPTEVSGPDDELEFLIAALDHMDKEALEDVLHHTGGVPEGLPQTVAVLQQTVQAARHPMLDGVAAGASEVNRHDGLQLESSEAYEVAYGDGFCLFIESKKGCLAMSYKWERVLEDFCLEGNNCSASDNNTVLHAKPDLGKEDINLRAYVDIVRKDSMKEIESWSKLLKYFKVNDDFCRPTRMPDHSMYPYLIHDQLEISKKRHNEVN